ncbi:ATP synthase F1 subunit gamma [Candidatus Nomurabacteria bacterium]|nr:ATP synthase F1 subunit gamma [Candidatus Nomurabacteria bacterium]
MAVSAKAIKTRIKSVKNTKKITKAMEMVSAAKMRRSVDAALATRMYANLCLELLHHLSHIDEPNVAFLQKRPVQNILLIPITSNRGLCGSFNSNVIKQAGRFLADKQNIAAFRDKDGEEILPEGDVKVDILGVGKKSALIAKRNNLDLVAVFDKLSEKPSYDDILPITQMITEGFIEKKYDKIALIYTHFESTLKQTVKVRQLLPVSESEIRKMIDQLPHAVQEVEKKEEDFFPIENYLFEPTMEEILEMVLPRLIEVQLFEAVLESAASEHSARMMAMKNASEAAGEMIDSLTLTFNKARQAAITQEISEIAGGAAALE